LALCLLGCAIEPKPVLKDGNERHFDAYLTWRDYEKTSDAETAMFIYNGEEVGRGGAGLRLVADRITTLPQGSVLLVYPAYRWTWFTDDALPHLPPYAGYHDGSLGAFLHALDARHIRSFRSDIDHLGRKLGPTWYQEKFNLEDPPR
jgi:hypothetical protein